MSRTALLLDSVFTGHDPGESHPERPERVRALERAFETSGILRRVKRITPRAATMDELAACHTREYLARAQDEIERGAKQLSTGDTAVGAKSWEVTVQAAGSVLNAVDAVVSGKAKNAFCAVRPPGHHATPDRGMGFCILNHVAVAARYAQRRHGVGRVLIIDWDVHHGNGTQDIFYEDGSVLFFSTHQWPWYPGTGRADEMGTGAGAGTTINCPLPAGSGAKEVIGEFDTKLRPAVKKFAPDLVIVSAGFDSREGDPLGRFTLSDADFATLTHIVNELAATSAKGRVVSVLEGGYNLAGLASAAVAHVSALI